MLIVYYILIKGGGRGLISNEEAVYKEELLHKTALIGTAHILRRILESSYDSSG